VNLPMFQSSSTPLTLMQNKWKSILDPVLASPITNPQILRGVVLSSGDNVINHKLGATPQGWIISDINAAVSVYRNAPFNDLTLTLNSSGSATINLVIY